MHEDTPKQNRLKFVYECFMIVLRKTDKMTVIKLDFCSPIVGFYALLGLAVGLIVIIHQVHFDDEYADIYFLDVRRILCQSH